MNKIKETLTALTVGEAPGALHINRKEHMPISDERFGMTLKCISQVAKLSAGTVLIINAELYKLVALAVFTVVFAVIYYGFRD